MLGILLGLLGPTAALAHTGEDVAGGLRAGLIHPISGLDHVLAMVAVGLWGAQLGPPALWLLPVTFPVVMAVGGALGIAGVPMPAVEVGIAVSAIALGAMVAAAARPRLRRRRRARRDLCHLPRLCPRRGAAERGRPARLQRGVRGRHRVSPC